MNALFAKSFHSILKQYGGQALESINESVFQKKLKANFQFNGDFQYSDGKVISSLANPLRLTNLSDKWSIVAPRFEFESDLGNVPTFVSKMFESQSMANYARLQPNSFPKSYSFHDATYKYHQVIFVNQGKMRTLSISRVQADVILYLSLAAEGARWLEAQLIYRAVRMFGSQHWKE